MLSSLYIKLGDIEFETIVEKETYINFISDDCLNTKIYYDNKHYYLLRDDNKLLRIVLIMVPTSINNILIFTHNSTYVIDRVILTKPLETKLPKIDYLKIITRCFKFK